MELFRAVTRINSDGRVVAIASAELGGGVPRACSRAPDSCVAGVQDRRACASGQPPREQSRAEAVPVSRRPGASPEASPVPGVLHVGVATHSLFTELQETLGDVIVEWAKRVGIA